MKNDKKGFTLVEIIVVVAILVVIAGIFSVNMIRTLNKNKEEENKNVVTTITSAAEAYVSANPEKVERLYNGYGYVDIKVGELRDEGFLSEKLKDVETGEIISDDEIVRVRFDVASAMGFTYPLSEEEQNAKAWSLVADDLTIEYDGKVDSQTWCASDQNKYTGLYDSKYVNKGNWADVKSKLYLEDNSEGGRLFEGDYFGEAKLEATSCNVNPKVAGTYNITYGYTDPSLKIEKTMNRTVYVRTSGNDVLSFTAEINNGKKIILNANRNNVPIRIVEKYKDGSTTKLESTVGTLKNIGYEINDQEFYTSESGTRVATVSAIKTNSDGSKPEAQRPEYSVTDSLVEIIIESKNCTPNNSSTCYLRCSQTTNYVDYNGTIYRVYGLSGNTVKVIYNGNEIVDYYGQVGSCRNNSCCNEGRYIYNRLGDSEFGFRTTMDRVLNSFAYEKNINGPILMSQMTVFGQAAKIALLSRAEYANISQSCPTNYLTGRSFWLIDAAERAEGAGDYNKGRNSAYAYNYAVNASGYVYKDGSYKTTTSKGDYGTNSVYTSSLVVKPTIFLNNPRVRSGDGTASNPYRIKR